MIGHLIDAASWWIFQHSDIIKIGVGVAVVILVVMVMESAFVRRRH